MLNLDRNNNNRMIGEKPGDRSEDPQLIGRTGLVTRHVQAHLQKVSKTKTKTLCRGRLHRLVGTVTITTPMHTNRGLRNTQQWKHCRR